MTEKISIAAALELLGLTLETANADSVRRAYRDLSRRYHPDSAHPDSGAEAFARLNAARALLDNIIDGDFPIALADSVERVGVLLAQSFVTACAQLAGQGHVSDRLILQTCIDSVRRTLQNEQRTATENVMALQREHRSLQRLIESANAPKVARVLWNNIANDVTSRMQQADAAVERAERCLEALVYIQINPDLDANGARFYISNNHTGTLL